MSKFIVKKSSNLFTLSLECHFKLEKIIIIRDNKKINEINAGKIETITFYYENLCWDWHIKHHHFKFTYKDMCLMNIKYNINQI